MTIAEWTIRKKTFSLVLTLFLIFGGFYAYDKLGRLEDPEFTIKDALVMTAYPGATSEEVEEEVTETLETGIQELSQLKRVVSISKAGLSIITVTIKDKYDKNSLPQVWDELRRKVNDVQSQLPPAAGPSLVYDDYGDVYGILLAITGKGFSYRELNDLADDLKKELLLVKDVAKIVTWGKQQEQIFVEISRAKMANLGIGLDKIYKTLEKQNLVVSSGSVHIDDQYIRINPTGEIDSVEEISRLLIRDNHSNKMVYLNDIAHVYRGYISPPQKHLRHNSEKAIAMGISTVSGGNVVTMGKAVEAKIKELSKQIPLGIQIHPIYFQGSIVEKSVNSFVVNLIEAIVIVIIVLMIFMGIRSGLLIGTVLLITVCSTILIMYLAQIDLQRISLGALIIALGMLVDNAIVVTEGMMIRIEQGNERIKAANEVVNQTMWPLLGATVIAILAFAAIGLSDDSTGEYLRSLFQVMFISLGMSWLIAITITPLLCVLFLKGKSKETTTAHDPYAGKIFQFYKKILLICLQFRWITITSVIGMLFVAGYGFTLLEDSFFPSSTAQQFMVHYWLPEGTDIRKTSDDLKAIEKYVQSLEDVTSVSTFVGEGAPRYMLVYSPEKSYDSYGLLLINVDDYKKIDGLIEQIRKHIAQTYLNATPKYEKVRLGPGGGYALEARFSGPESNSLRALSDQAKQFFRQDKNATTIRDDWRERVSIIRPQFNESRARRAGVSRDDLAEAIKTTFDGRKVGIYREEDELIPIVSRPPKEERDSVNNLYNIQIWIPSVKKTIPIRQVVNGFKTDWEDAVINRRNKKRTITAQADPLVGNASVILEKVKPNIDAITLPIGYELEWGGEYEDSSDAKAGLSKNLPPTFLVMVLITIGLFNALKQPLIIWLTVPLGIIGVTFGLTITNESFGFMALLGFLSLSGMLIKNAIVLIDEIDLQLRQGKTQLSAILDAGVSRMRPVSMAAITTILGMIPLLSDVFFVQMAVTIMFGLAFATLLTLIVVPVFYAVFNPFQDSAQHSTPISTHPDQPPI